MQPTIQHAELLTCKEVEQLLGLSRVSIYSLMRAHRFVLPIRIGTRAIRWRRADIDQWLATRPVAGPALLPGATHHAA